MANVVFVDEISVAVLLQDYYQEVQLRLMV